MTTELKSCPFCGGDAEIDTHQAYRNLSSGQMEDAVAVYCLGECGTQMTRCLPDFHGISRGDLAAILVDLWNRRAEQASQPQDVHYWRSRAIIGDTKEITLLEENARLRKELEFIADNADMRGEALASIAGEALNGN